MRIVTICLSTACKIA